MTDRAVQLIDQMPTDRALETFRSCCGADAWLRGMEGGRPFGATDRLHQAADDVFDSLCKEDWLEAFSCHPKIGDLESLRMKFSGNRQWSASEQSGVSNAGEETIRQLAEGNRDYEERFGYIFIICASGKSAAEILQALLARLPNEPDDELKIAASEQRKITHLRLDKMITQLSTDNS